MIDMNVKDLVIVGCGGLAKEIKWLIEECNKEIYCWDVLGWISLEKPGSIVSGLPVIGDDDWLLNYSKPIDVVVAVGNGFLRKKIVANLKQNPFISFPNIISPSAELSNCITLGEGTVIASKSILTVDIMIGSFFFCNLACTIGHDCVFGDYVTLNPGVNVSGNVSLGDCVTMGTGASIIQGLSVGENTTIGAGAVVVRNIPSDCTVVGVPAKPL